MVYHRKCGKNMLAIASDRGERTIESSDIDISKERDYPTTAIEQNAISVMGKFAKLGTITDKVTKIRHQKSVTLRASIKLETNTNTTAKGLISGFRLMSWMMNDIYKRCLSGNLTRMYRAQSMAIMVPRVQIINVTRITGLGMSIFTYQTLGIRPII